MADPAEDTVDVVIEDPKVPDPEVKVVQAEADPPAEAIKPDAALEEMRQSLDQERAARQEAERRAAHEAQNAHKAQGEVQDSNLHLVVNAIELIKQNTDGLKARYATAAASGDWDAAADVQAEMSANAAKLLQLEQGKAAIEAQPKREAPVRELPADPVEALAMQLSPRSAAWVRAHPQFARDQNLYRRMLAAHNLAETDGAEPDSDDYFSRIETTLGLRQQAEDPSGQAAQVVQRRASPPAAAPVSRGGELNGQRPNTVRLTAAEVEMAGNMGMTVEDYAKNKQSLIKEGKLH